MEEHLGWEEVYLYVWMRDARPRPEEKREEKQEEGLGNSR